MRSHLRPPRLDDFELPTWPTLDRAVRVDERTGALTARVPIPVTTGRFGFTPTLALIYHSARRNSPFGWGWALDVPSIARRTNPEVPRYREVDDDTFVLEHGGCDEQRHGEQGHVGQGTSASDTCNDDSMVDPTGMWVLDSEELVPALRANGGWVDDRFVLGDYLVQRYRRRLETSHDRIEHWIHQPSGQAHWRVIDRNNVTSLYGSTDETRVGDPSDPARVVRWLLAERFDDRGNIMRYGYKRENVDGVDLSHASERGRRDDPDAQGGMRYLKRIQYANSAPHDRFNWYYEIVFDYGDHDTDEPRSDEDRAWSVRPDPFSDHRSGFECRVWRRCERVLMFHRFDELDSEATLVGGARLQFRDQDGVSVLASMDRFGRTRSGSGSASTERRLPPMVMSYEKRNSVPQLGTIDAGAIERALIDENASVRWIDLDGVGAAGLVVRSGAQTQYVRNLGGGSFGDPEPLPGGAHSRAFEEPVIDLTDEEVRQASEATHERQYVPSTTLRLTADVNQDDPFIGYIDLNGDQADDVVVADDHVIRWYPSQREDGFADPIVLHLDPRDIASPHRLHVDARQSFHVADMNGDGLADLVRVRSGEVVYWPNRGRGRFGAAVVMADPPDFHGNVNGGASVLLADLTGNGLADVISVRDDKVAIWLNEGGNRFTHVEDIDAPGIRFASGNVSAVDLFGVGLACIVWVDRRSAPTVRYIAPFGNRRPGLLTALSNNSGAEAHVTYTTTTELWERDRRDGVEWLTTSAIPADVVRRIEILDDISGTHRSLSYRFRHAAFDEHEGIFAGFAYAECADGDGVPEIVTSSLRHTGTLLDGRSVAEILAEKAWIGQSSLPQDVSGTVSAARALRGLLVSSDVSFVSGDCVHYPVTSRACDWHVRQVQPARAGRPPVHDVRIGEVIDREHGSVPEDTRVVHQLTLARDDYGTTTLSARIYHGARGERHQRQTATKIIVTETAVANRVDQSTWYRVGVPLGHVTWELDSLVPDSDYFSAAELLEALERADAAPTEQPVRPARTRPIKRLLERVRVRYLSNDLTRVLEIGSIESRALVAWRESLVLDREMVGRHYASVDDVEKLLAAQGRYQSDDEGWWSTLEQYSYDASNFYAVNAVTGPHGGTTHLRYDAAMLAVVEVKDPFGNVSSALVHPRARRPWMLTDENGNLWGWRFDALGAVLSETIAGKPDADPLDVVVQDSLEATGGDDPTSVVTYDLDGWLSSGSPIWRRIRTRQRHRDRDTSIEERIEHYDGFGRGAGKATRQDDGTWLIEEIVERDCRGNVTRIAEPFYSEDPWPESNERKQALDNATSIVRDPLGRVIRVDHPDGTTTGVERSPWRVAYWDHNDTVVESGWYEQRQGASRGRAGDLQSRETMIRQHRARAAALAAIHARTPLVEHLDAFGNVVMVEYVLSDQGSTRGSIWQVTHRDWQGRVLEVVDAEGEQTWSAVRDLLGRPIAIRLASGVEVLHIWDASDNVVWSRDATGNVIKAGYDNAGRKIRVYSEDASGRTTLIERTIWGGGDLEVADAASKNLIGSPAISLTPAGVVRFERDVFGHPTKETLRLPAREEITVDLDAAETAANADQIEILLDATGANGRGALAGSTVSIATSRDALGRIVDRVGPTGSKVSYRRSVDGLVTAIDFHHAGGEVMPIVSSVARDSHGRCRMIRLGSSIAIRRELDAVGNVIALTAWARGQERPIQDSYVVYDPEGNISSVLEKGQLMTSCIYDSLDRLTKLEGIEPIDEDDGSVGVRRFSKTYTYDRRSNVLTERHHADAGVGNREIRREYERGSMLRCALTSDGVETVYAYDAMGRLVDAGDERYIWDGLSRLIGLESASRRTTLSYLPTDAQPECATIVGQADVAGVPCGDLSYRRRTVHPSGAVDDVLRIAEFERSIELDDGAIVRDVYSTVISLDGITVAVVRHALTRAEVSQYDVDRSIRFQLVDVSGSPVVEVSESGEVIDQEWFLPSGQTLHRRGRSVEALASKRLGFRSVWRDSDTDVVEIDGRWYSPRLGRYLTTEPWTQVDPGQGSA